MKRERERERKIIQKLFKDSQLRLKANTYYQY